MAYIKLAPYNAPNSWKASATAVLPGVLDTQVIANYYGSGNIIEIGPGKVIDTDTWGILWLPPNITFIGQGPTTILNIGGIYLGNGWMNTGNVELGGFNMTGITQQPPYSSVFVGVSSNASNLYIHDIYTDQQQGGHFDLYINGAFILSNIVFSRCISESAYRMGFCISGEKANPIIQDVTYYRCKQHNAGITNYAVPWMAGFDIAEFGTDQPTSTSRRITVIKCESDGAFESTFHHEYATIKKDIVYLDCAATKAGLKPDNFQNDNGTVGPQYGAGFLMTFKPTDDFIANGLTGGNNKLGDMRVLEPTGWINYTPPVDMVWGSNKTVTRINQGNCIGIEVIDNDNIDLYLYSSNELPVTQQITLSNGSKLRVQFTDFAIYKGVQYGIRIRTRRS
jgi:hypothetical protein